MTIEEKKLKIVIRLVAEGTITPEEAWVLVAETSNKVEFSILTTTEKNGTVTKPYKFTNNTGWLEL